MSDDLLFIGLLDPFLHDFELLLLRVVLFELCVGHPLPLGAKTREDRSLVELFGKKPLIDFLAAPATGCGLRPNDSDKHRLILELIAWLAVLTQAVEILISLERSVPVDLLDYCLFK